MTKTIYDQVEEEIAAIEGIEGDDAEVVTTEEPAQVDELPPAEEPEKVEEPVVDPKPEVDNEAMARMRWENSELKRQQREAQELAQRAIELQKQPKTEEDPEPNKAEDREEWLEWKVRQADKAIDRANRFIEQQEQSTQKQKLIQGAIEEFTQYEQRFSLKAPDYDDAAKFFQSKVKESIATLQPHLSESQIAQAAANQLLQMGSTFVNQGLDPAEAIYNIAKKQGFTKVEAQTTESKPAKASLETIEKNKSKSANGLGTGAGKQPVTIASLEKASVQDMYNLSDEEIYNAMYK